MVEIKPASGTKEVRYTGIQPQYFPRLHYFNRVINTDFFMVRDDVQFVRKHKYPDGHIGPSYQMHCPIKDGKGIRYLTISMTDNMEPIYRTKISYTAPWQEKQLNILQYSYHKSPFFNDIYPELEQLISQEYESLTDLNLATFLWGLTRIAGWETSIPTRLAEINERLTDESEFRLKSIKLASQTDFYKQNTKHLSPNEKLVGLCREVGANTNYCGGTALAAYIDKELFQRNNIKIHEQNWRCPSYPQQFDEQFIANLSIIDLLMNVPAAEAKKILVG